MCSLGLLLLEEMGWELGLRFGRVELVVPEVYIEVTPRSLICSGGVKVPRLWLVLTLMGAGSVLFVELVPLDSAVKPRILLLDWLLFGDGRECCG
jgi:hypothetical protein